MPRTAATPRGRILAVAGAAAALAGAGTAAAASASAATIPATGPAITTTTTAATATTLPAGLSASTPRHALTTTPGPSPLAPATTAASTAPAAGTHAAAAGTHGTAVTVTARHAAGHARTHTAAAAKPARHHTARHHTAPAGPYQMYDSVTPSAIPGGKAVATYADGPYAASPAALHGRNITWIDTNGTDPRGATVLDVEPGDATPAGAATWAAQRLDAHPHATAVIYTMRSEWTAAQTAVAALPAWQQHHVRWWIADPTGTPHLVPGSNATQWYWGTHYDISTVNPGF